MPTAHIKKWIKGTRRSDKAVDVAARSLKQRMDGVQYYLPLAAESSADDLEYVHQLRVATRRALAALRLYGALLPSRQVEWFEKQLKRIRRTANEARDVDVLMQRLNGRVHRGHSEFVRRMTENRLCAQEPIVEIHRRLGSSGRFEKHVSKLLRRARRGSKPAGRRSPRFGGWAAVQLRPIVRQFFKAARGDLSDADGLHRLRIRSKQLRYAMELLSGAFPKRFRTRVYPRIEALQVTLGEINDHAAAARQFRHWVIDAELNERKYLQTLLERESVGFDRTRRAFLNAWNGEEIKDLATEFERFLYKGGSSGRKRRLKHHS